MNLPDIAARQAGPRALPEGVINTDHQMAPSSAYHGDFSRLKEGYHDQRRR